MFKEVLFGDFALKVKQVEHLSFHQVDLRQSKAESFKALDRCVFCPVFVLRARVVQVLRSKNEGGKEDSVDCATHALCNRRQPCPQSAEEDQRSHQSWYLDR